MIYKIAGLNVKINNKLKFTERFCKDYLTEETDFDLETEVTNEDFEKEKSLSPNYSDGYIENICLYRSLCSRLPDFNRFLLHSAILEYGGKAYAFSGRSGAGKSTHTNLWLEFIDGTKIINGDKPIIECKGDKFIAHGTPWNGKEGRGYNGRAEIGGLCFIEQAKENKIERLSVSDFANRIFSQVLFPTDESNASKTLELIDKFVKTVPAFVLHCDVSEEAVKTSFEALVGEKYRGKI